jgi:hypothetical protein
MSGISFIIRFYLASIIIRYSTVVPIRRIYMVKVILPLIVVIMSALPFFKKANSGPAADKIAAAQFKNLMRTVAAGWNEGNAKKAADCYTDDAIYTEPPDRQVYVGRQALCNYSADLKRGGFLSPAPKGGL